MKKFLIPVAFLPFSSFGAFNLDGFAGVRVVETYLYTWTDYNSTFRQGDLLLGYPIHAISPDVVQYRDKFYKVEDLPK